jgi:hypothetical protein
MKHVSIFVPNNAGCVGQEKQEKKFSLLPPFLVFNCFSNSNGHRQHYEEVKKTVVSFTFKYLTPVAI